MDLLIVLTYVALAWAVFKIFRIPVNQWTLATAALGGVFLVSGLILLMWRQAEAGIFLGRITSAAGSGVGRI